MNLSNNSLEQLPIQVSRLTNLITLNLENNRLTRIPAIIRLLINLIELKLKGNPLCNSFEKQLQTKPIRQIRDYLNDLEDGQRLWPEFKLLVLGQEVC